MTSRYLRYNKVQDNYILTINIDCRNELHMERPSRVRLAEPTVTTKFKYIAVGREAYLSGPALFCPSSVGPLCNQ